jgi:hypothetical protein
MSDCPIEEPAFRVFFLDEQGRIKKSKALKTMVESDAVVEAQNLADGRKLELYDGCRLVLTIEAS